MLLFAKKYIQAWIVVITTVVYCYHSCLALKHPTIGHGTRYANELFTGRMLRLVVIIIIFSRS